MENRKGDTSSTQNTLEAVELRNANVANLPPGSLTQTRLTFRMQIAAARTNQGWTRLGTFPLPANIKKDEGRKDSHLSKSN